VSSEEGPSPPSKSTHNAGGRGGRGGGSYNGADTPLKSSIRRGGTDSVAFRYTHAHTSRPPPFPPHLLQTLVYICICVCVPPPTFTQTVLNAASICPAWQQGIWMYVRAEHFRVCVHVGPFECAVLCRAFVSVCGTLSSVCRVQLYVLWDVCIEGTTLCEYLSMSECQYVSMSVCQYVSMSVRQYVSMSVGQYVSMSVCQHVSRSVGQ